MKRKMLFGSSAQGWAATSPLCYTLQRYAKYCHFGYTKLHKIFDHTDWHKSIPNKKVRDLQEIYYQVLNGTWEQSMDARSLHAMNTKEDFAPLKDLPLKHLFNISHGPVTIKKYIDYWTTLHDHIVPQGYKSIADSNLNPLARSPEFRTKFVKALTDTFDVKVLCITRDPIRRAWGRMMRDLDDITNPDRVHPDFLDYNVPRLYVRNPAKGHQFRSDLFGEENCHTVVMEELWEGDGSEKTRLEEFLDHPIPKLWHNCYSPDTGHLIQYDERVPCQHRGQNIRELTPELYMEIRQLPHVDLIYQQWIDKFGKLPLHWGEPIDYYKNASIVYG